MIPVTITPEQRDVAEDYWGVPWTQLSGPQIKEAMVWRAVLASLVPVPELRFLELVRP